MVQGGWHGPQLSWHSSQHSLSTGPAPLLRDQRQSQQPGPPARAPRPTQAEFEPSVTQTATKDLQKGALPPAFAQTVFARKCRNSSMTLAIVVIDTGIVFVKFLFFLFIRRRQCILVLFTNYALKVLLIKQKNSLNWKNKTTHTLACVCSTALPSGDQQHCLVSRP